MRFAFLHLQQFDHGCESAGYQLHRSHLGLAYPLHRACDIRNRQQSCTLCTGPARTWSTCSDCVAALLCPEYDLSMTKTSFSLPVLTAWRMQL